MRVRRGGTSRSAVASVSVVSTLPIVMTMSIPFIAPVFWSRVSVIVRPRASASVLTTIHIGAPRRVSPHVQLPRVAPPSDLFISSPTRTSGPWSRVLTRFPCPTRIFAPPTSESTVTPTLRIDQLPSSKCHFAQITTRRCAFNPNSQRRALFTISPTSSGEQFPAQRLFSAQFCRFQRISRAGRFRSRR